MGLVGAVSDTLLGPEGSGSARRPRLIESWLGGCGRLLLVVGPADHTVWSSLLGVAGVGCGVPVVF